MNTFFLRILFQERLALTLHVAITQAIHRGLQVFVGFGSRHHFLKTGQTVYHALLNQLEIKVDGLNTHETVFLIFVDVRTNLLSHIHHLRILFLALQRLVQVFNELLAFAAVFVLLQHIGLDLVTLVETEGIVQTIGIVR